MNAYLSVVGISHNTTPIAFREKLAISASQLPNALLLLRRYSYPGVILSTCNRTEIYAISSKGHSAEPRIIDFLKDHANIHDTDLSAYSYAYHDEDVISHLFRVAAGLDSMVVGEFEILGQVSQALETAEQAQMADLPLRNFFQSAMRTGRRVRDETLISKNALSVSSVAVDLATKVIPDLSGCNMLVIGAGEAGRLVAKAAKDRGACHIVVTSRSRDRVSALASMLGGRPAAFEELKGELCDSDIVISCTGAPHTVLDAGLIGEAMQARPERPLVIIDIAVPRDVEPDVERISNVFLHNIDDLVQISNSNRELRGDEVQRAQAIVLDEAERFSSWWRTLEVRPTVSALIGKAESIRTRQLNLTLKKLQGLGDEERQSLEAMTKSIVQRILHDPIKCLKENGDSKQSYIQAVRELFRLDEEKQN